VNQEQESLALAFSIAAGVVQLMGYIVYGKLVKQASVGSWAIWTCSATTDLAAYACMTEDLSKNFLPATCAVASVVLFARMVWAGKMKWPEHYDWGFFGIDCVITIAWYFTSATVASVLYQVSTIMSFGPIVRGQMKGTDDRENPLPWGIWTGAYLLMTISLFLSYDNWQELAYPIANLSTHLGMFAIALRLKKQGPFA